MTLLTDKELLTDANRDKEFTAEFIDAESKQLNIVSNVVPVVEVVLLEEELLIK